jgi:hypothetical protein
MKNARTKIIVGLVAFLTAGSLFAIKGKMMHHRGMHHKKANVENCHGMQHDADVNKKSKNHHERAAPYENKSKKESTEK